MKTNINLLTFGLALIPFLSFGQCTISSSNLMLIADNGTSCSYEIDITYLNSGNDNANGDLLFSSPTPGVTITAGAGPHDCACDNTTYTLAFDAPCGSIIEFSGFYNGPGAGGANDCTTNTLETPLPVELVDFTAKYDDDEILLEWSTASEINNNGFFIEKSQDGFSFQEIGFVRGAGNSHEMVNYSFADEHISHTYSKNIYYRLNQVDYDGANEYSKIISVSNQNIESFGFPQLINNRLDFERPIEFIGIYTLDGKQVDTKTNQSSIDLNYLIQGMYIVKIPGQAKKVFVLE